MEFYKQEIYDFWENYQRSDNEIFLDQIML